LITLGALEPQFYALLLDKLGLTDVDPAGQFDKTAWKPLKARFTELFASRPRAYWCALLEGSDVCFAPARGNQPGLRGHVERGEPARPDPLLTRRFRSSESYPLGHSQTPSQWDVLHTANYQVPQPTSQQTEAGRLEAAD
jgi:hypothetical protein